MPDHAHKQIREAVAARLTGLATTGSNVFTSRFYSLNEKELPALLITTEGEAVETFNQSPVAQNRVLQVVVIPVVKSVSNTEDTLDEIKKEVEVAIFSDKQLGLGNGIIDLMLTEVSETERESEGEKPVISQELTFQINFTTPEGAPDVIG